MKLKPLGDRLIVRAIEEEATTASGIVLPDTAKEKPQKGKVLAVGDGKVNDETGKRTPLEDYRLTARGRKGVINMKTTPRIGKVVGILSVKEDSELMIITKQGQIIRIDSSEIRQAGRSTQGVRLVNVDEGDQVAAASGVTAALPARAIPAPANPGRLWPRRPGQHKRCGPARPGREWRG